MNSSGRLLLLVAVLTIAPARATALIVVSESTPQQHGVTRLIVHSERIGRDFRVVVSQPVATAFLPGQKLPAIYALDGGNGIAGPLGQYLGNTWQMSAGLVVSVDDAPPEGNHRLDDLAHARWRPQDRSLPEMGGGGAAFEASGSRPNPAPRRSAFCRHTNVSSWRKPPAPYCPAASSAA